MGLFWDVSRIHYLMLYCLYYLLFLEGALCQDCRKKAACIVREFYIFCICEHGLNLFEHQLVKCLFLDARRGKYGYEWRIFNRTKNRTTDRTNRTKRLIFRRKSDIIELQNKWILWLIYQVF